MRRPKKSPADHVKVPQELLQRLAAVNARLVKRNAGPLLNAERAIFGELAIVAFASRTGQAEDVAEDPETVLGDLLADLMHFCDAKDVDFEEALRRGRNHHDEEITEEAEQKEADEAAKANQGG